MYGAELAATEKQINTWLLVLFGVVLVLFARVCRVKLVPSNCNRESLTKIFEQDTRVQDQGQHSWLQQSWLNARQKQEAYVDEEAELPSFFTV